MRSLGLQQPLVPGPVPLYETIRLWRSAMNKFTSLKACNEAISRGLRCQTPVSCRAVAAPGSSGHELRERADARRMQKIGYTAGLSLIYVGPPRVT